MHTTSGYGFAPTKACVTFDLEQKGPTAASDLAASLKAAFETSGISVEGPFANSLGYAIVCCKMPERIDVIVLPGDRVDPGSWMLRMVAFRPLYKRVFSRSKSNVGKHSYRVLSSTIQEFLRTIGARDVRWLTDEEAALQERARQSARRYS